MEKVKYILVDADGKPFTNEDGSFVINEGVVNDEPTTKTDNVNDKQQTKTDNVADKYGPPADFKIDETELKELLNALSVAEKKLDEQNKILEESIKKHNLVPPIKKIEKDPWKGWRDVSSFGLDVNSLKISGLEPQGGKK